MMFLSSVPPASLVATWQELQQRALPRYPVVPVVEIVIRNETWIRTLQRYI